jgi:hypothetical protein
MQQIRNAYFGNIWGRGEQCTCFSHLNILVLTFLIMEMMGLSSTEKTGACLPGSLLLSLEGIVGLFKPVLTDVHTEFLTVGAEPETL